MDKFRYLVFIFILSFLVIGCSGKDTGGSGSAYEESETEAYSIQSDAMTVQSTGAEGDAEMMPMEEINAGEAAAEDNDIMEDTAISLSADDIAGEETEVSANETEQEPEETERETDEGTFTSEPIPDAVFARMSGVSFPEGCTISRDDLRYLRLSYHDFNGQSQVGELVCNKKVADDMTDIFRELYKRGYQIEKMKLIDDYGGDDDLSCADNNTSCFNYRTVAGSNNLSKHAMGIAIDINPFYNPYVTYPNGVEHISPPGSEPYADRSADFPHKIGPGDDAYELFKAKGYTWGGDWKTLKDYQHFQKSK